jgi:hypothetical protein
LIQRHAPTMMPAMQIRDKGKVQHLSLE